MQPPDIDTFELAHLLIRAARSRGRDEVEELNHARMLLTPARDKEIRLQAMNFLLNAITSWRPAEMLRKVVPAGNPGSPKDMYNAIVEFLEEQIREWERT